MSTYGFEILFSDILTKNFGFELGLSPNLRVDVRDKDLALVLNKTIEVWKSGELYFSALSTNGIYTFELPEEGDYLIKLAESDAPGWPVTYAGDNLSEIVYFHNVQYRVKSLRGGDVSNYSNTVTV